MLRKMKKSIAVILVATFLMTMFVISPSAAEKKDNSSASSAEYSVSGTNSAGDLLADEIANYRAQQNETEGSYVISDIKVSGSIATVSYSAQADCTVLVALYDENTDVMLASGKAEATSNKTSVDVTIETENMPTAFVVKGFMLDSNNAPLSASFSTVMYTTKMQELMKMTVNDFESDRVLNLDDDETKNFMVYNDSVKKFNCTDKVNTIQSADSDKNTYVFTNADESLKNLKQGDIFVNDEDPDKVLIIKVGSISVDGNTVTVTGVETSLEEVFDHVKIETQGSLDDAKIDENSGSKGITYVGSDKTAKPAKEKELSAPVGAEQNSASVGAIEIEQKMSYEHEFKFSNDDDGESDVEDDDGWFGAEGEINGAIKVGLEAEVSVYLAFRQEKEVKLSLEAKVFFQSTINGTININPKLPDFEIPVIGGLRINLTLGFFVETSGNFETVFEASAKVGFSYNGRDGFKNISEKPQTDYSMNLEGELYAGISIDITLVIVDDDIGEAGFSGKVGIDTTASLTKNKIDIEGITVKHDCKRCISGDIAFKVVIEPIVNAGGKDVFGSVISDDFSFEAEITVPLTSWHYSFDYDEFGFNLCPHATCTFLAKVVDEKGNPVEGADIDDYWNGIPLGTTGSLGLLEVTLKGNESCLYQLHATKGELTDVANIYISDFEDILEYRGTGDWCSFKDSDNYKNNCYVFTLHEKGDDDDDNPPPGPNPDPETTTEPTEPVSTNPSTTTPSSTEPTTNPPSTEPTSTKPTEPFVLDSGKCGDNLTWEFYSDGRLDISGSGHMYYMNDVPWSTYKDNIISVEISEGVTSICEKAFKDCTNLTSITIPNSVIAIGSYAFENCKSLTSIIIPESVTMIDWFTFSNCESLTSVTILGSLTSIESGAFCNCISLRSITIPNSVKWIESQAFFGCESLTSVTLPNSLMTIERDTFEYCESLRSIIIPDSVTWIQQYAFAHCKNLTSIAMSNNITRIETSAFYDTKWYDDQPEGIVYLGKAAYTFKGDERYKITSLTFTEGTMMISDSFGGYFTNLTSVTIPRSVRSIGFGAFGHCESLTCVTLSKDTMIDSFAFRYCNDNLIFNYYEDDNSVGASFAKASGEAVSTQPKSTDSEISKITAEYIKVANADYIIAVVKDPNAQDILSAENLLYINQYTADKNGKISALLPVPDDVGDDYDVIIFGAEGGADVPDNPQKGDVDGDGKVTVDDVTSIQKYVADTIKFDDKQIAIADVNNDGKVNIDDATMIQKYIADIIVSLG